MSKLKTKKEISSKSWNIANRTYTMDTTNMQSSEQLEESEKKLEEEAMGEIREVDTLKSKVFERNLNQMIDVLHLRLSALETAAKVRLDFCAEDLKADSSKESKQAPKIMEEFEDQHVNSKGLLKDVKVSNGHGKDINLVSAEGVFIDPVRLVIKTKQPTETAKRLETKLEDLFSTSILREMKGKKSKASTRIARSKKSEAKKNDIRKSNRLLCEKNLTMNIDNYITRSVNDEELKFIIPERDISLGGVNQFGTAETIIHAPSYDAMSMKWPISVKWPTRDMVNQQGKNVEAVDGDMDPELLLKYALERINLPSGESIFHHFLHNNCIQQYFLCLFWFIKTKFFQNDCDNEIKYLLHMVSNEYVKIIEYLSNKAKAESNKDFIFQFLPYLLCNAVYYGFFYLCPGSRHMYSKGFRKTILLQIVQTLHGIQLCPVSVRVMWGKLFPEEMQDDEEEESEQLLPMTLPIGGGGTKKTNASSSAGNVTTSRPATVGGGENTKRGKPGMLDFGGDSFREGDNRINQSDSEDVDNDSRVAKQGMTKALSMGTMRLGGDTFAGKLATVDPLDRVTLRPPPVKSKYLVRRQKQEESDVNDVSPCIQQYMSAPTSTGGKNPQALYRTVPVNWCVSGGSDTHRRRQIPKELHDELSMKVKQAPKVERVQTIKAHKSRVREGRMIDRTCAALIARGPQAVGRFSLELMRQLKLTTHGLQDVKMDDDSNVNIGSVHIDHINEFEDEDEEFLAASAENFE